jgi:small-conductance mechanosensitive channel
MTRAEIERWLIGLAIVAGSWLVGWLFRRVLAGRLHALASRTKSDLDDLLLAALGPHVPLWFLMGGVAVAVRYFGMEASKVAGADRAMEVAFLFSLTLAFSSFLTRLVARRAAMYPEALPATSLTQNLVRIVVIGLGLMVIASTLGIAITPVLTALGVGSLAVALALQPTLTNLFAGFYVTLARQIRVGDYVELETGQTGYVVDIGWRSTKIRELPNNLILVPNARIAEIIVKNYSLPENEQAALVQVGVSYASDLAQVERVTIEEATAVQREVEGAVREFQPFIRYNAFGDSSVNFTVILRVREFVDRYLVTHEFMKRLHRRYQREGIEIPFPQRVVHMAAEEEKS